MPPRASTWAIPPPMYPEPMTAAFLMFGVLFESLCIACPYGRGPWGSPEMSGELGNAPGPATVRGPRG